MPGTRSSQYLKWLGLFMFGRPDFRKRVLGVLLGLFFVLWFSFSTTVEAQVISIRVGVYNNPPLSFLNEDGVYQGLVVDLLTEIAHREGWKLEFVACEWKNCLGMLEDGQIDLLGAIAYTEERATRFDFNEQSYFANWGVVYTRPDNAVQSLLELDGMTIACVEDDIYTRGVQNLLSQLGLKATYLPARDYDAVFEMVESGQADAGVVARLFGLMNEARYRVRASPIILSPIQLRYAATKGAHPEILRTIDRYLKAWKEDPQSPYFQALNRWLNHRSESGKLPSWVGWALAALVFWGAVALFGIGFLRRRIKLQTKDLRATQTRLRTLVEQVPAIIYTESASEPGKTLYVSPQFEALTGHSPEDWLKEKYGWKKYVHPDDLERVVVEDERTSCAGEPFCLEYRLLTKDGNVIWVRDDAVLVRDSNGQPLFWQGVMFDISERKRAEEDIGRHLSEMEALYENGLAISQFLDPKQIGQKLVENFSRFLSWEHITIRLRREESDELELIAFTQPGLTDENRDEVAQRFNALVSRVGQGLSGWVIQTGQCIRAGNVREYPQFADTHPNVKAGLYAPLRIGDRVIGCISVESETPNAFSEHDERLLSTFATQAAVAFENARLYQEAVRNLEQRMVLHRASQEIVSSGLDLEALYLTIHRAVTDLMPADIFFLALIDDVAQDVMGVYFVERGKRYPQVRFKMDEGFSGHVIQTNAPLRIEDYQTQAKEISVHPVLIGEQTYPRSVMVVPLHSGSRIIGVMSVQSYQPRVYSADDQNLLEMLAAYAGYALENARLFDSERKQRLLSETLREALGAGASLASSLEFEMVLDRLLESLERVIPFEGGCIMLVDAEHDMIRIARTRGYLNHGPQAVAEIQRLTFKISETANLRWMYENRKPLIIPDVRAYPGWIYVKESESTRSWAGAPIIINDEVTAFFSLDSEEVNFFTEEQALLLSAFAGQASLALQNARLYDQVRRRADRLALLYNISQKLSTLMTVDAIGESVIPIIENLLGWKRGSLWLQNEAGGLDMLYHATPGLQGEAREKELARLRSLGIRVGRGIVGRVIQTGEIIRCGNVRLNEHYVEGDASIRSELCVPLCVHGSVIGCINFESEQENAFTEDDEQLALTLAGEISSAVERARLYEQTRRRADELAALAAENEHLLKETQHRLQFVSALHTIDQAIASSLDIKLTMNIILDQVLQHLGVDTAAIYLFNPHLNQLEFAAGRGSVSGNLHASPLSLSDPIVSNVILERQMVRIQNLTAGKSLPKRQILAVSEGFVFYAAHPLVAKGEAKGLLEVFHRSSINPDAEWLEYYHTLAGQAAVALDTAFVFSELQRANIELTLAYDATIEGWSKALDLRDEDTEGHTQRVTEMTLRLARQMGLREPELIHVWRGALLHDIGKMGIPDSILRKPGPLDENELEIMRRHPVYAYELLSKIEYLRPALDIPYCHHEKWDGSGYPRGLKGEQIPFAARIFAIVDVWDALCSNRFYRQAWARDDALEYIVSQSGKHFDPRVVQAFLTMLRSE